MSVPDDPVPASFDALLTAARTQGGRGPAPVHLWHPPYCGEIDMRIARDGTWFYGGTPIGRPALVRLFASILRKDPDRFVLVTPVEMVAIIVEDVPFLAVEMRSERADHAPELSFRTNMDEWITAGLDHPLRFEREESGGLRPYLRVRGELWARLVRPLFFELVDYGEVRDIGDESMFGIASGGAFFAMAPAGEIATP